MNVCNLILVGLQYTKKMLTTQVTSLKKNLGIFDKYAHQSGFGMDSRGVVTGPPSALNAFYAAHPGTSQYANAPLPHYALLLTLFGRKFIFNFSPSYEMLKDEYLLNPIIYLFDR